MITLITYDISDPKRLRRMHKFLKEFGVNTQKSVFECDLDDHARRRIRQFCARELDLDKDAVRLYSVCAGCLKNVEISGQGIKITQLDYRIL